MPIKKRVRVSQKREAVRRIQAGEAIEAVAASYQVTTMTVRNWVDTYNTPAPKSPEPALPAAVKTVPIPKVSEIPLEDSGAGGLDAARAAAGLGPEPQPAPEEPPREEPKPEAPKIDPAQGLIFMSKIGLQVSVRFYAARLKVKLTDQVKELTKLTAEEEQQLETYAPFAAPFISEIITKYGPVIGAGIYGFIYFTMLTDRFAAIKELAPKKEVEAAGEVKK